MVILILRFDTYTYQSRSYYGMARVVRPSVIFGSVPE